MSTTALRGCPVCEQRRAEQLHRQKFIVPDDYPLGDQHTIVACSTCGLVYADLTATQDDYDTFYSKRSRYEDQQNSTGSGESDLDRARLGRTAEILNGYLLSKDARVLDVGCTGGGLLLALHHLGYRNLVGLDPSEGCVRNARQKNLSAYQGWFTNMPAEIGNFNCITVSHVLEHILDVPRALSHLGSHLEDGALVFIEVPDATQYLNYVYAPFQDFNTEHINHFSSKCLDNAMSRHGYSCFGRGERVLQVSEHTFTPSVYGIYRRTANPPDPSPDTELKRAIINYIERSSALLNKINVFLDDTLRESRDLVVWGTGQLVLKLLAETNLSRANIVAFVDSNPIHHGHILAGVQILSPEAIRNYPQPILIATMLHERAIAAQARALGLTNQIIFLPQGRFQATHSSLTITQSACSPRRKKIDTAPTPRAGKPPTQAHARRTRTPASINLIAASENW